MWCNVCVCVRVCVSVGGCVGVHVLPRDSIQWGVAPISNWRCLVPIYTVPRKMLCLIPHTTKCSGGV